MIELDGTPNNRGWGRTRSSPCPWPPRGPRQLPSDCRFIDIWPNYAGREPRLPLPMTNMISGGKHAGGNLDFQDVLIMPIGARGLSHGLEWIVRVYRRLWKAAQ